LQSSLCFPPFAFSAKWLDNEIPFFVFPFFYICFWMESTSKSKLIFKEAFFDQKYLPERDDTPVILATLAMAGCMCNENLVA
jgi:hypothetical protein